MNCRIGKISVLALLITLTPNVGASEQLNNLFDTSTELVNQGLVDQSRELLGLAQSSVQDKTTPEWIKENKQGLSEGLSCVAILAVSMSMMYAFSRLVEEWVQPGQVQNSITPNLWVLLSLLGLSYQVIDLQSQTYEANKLVALNQQLRDTTIALDRKLRDVKKVQATLDQRLSDNNTVKMLAMIHALPEGEAKSAIVGELKRQHWSAEIAGGPRPSSCQIAEGTRTFQGIRQGGTVYSYSPQF